MNNLMRRSGILAVLCLVLCMMLLVTACGGEKTPAETTGADTTTGADVTTKAPDVTTKAPEVTTEDPNAGTTEDPNAGTTEDPNAGTTEAPVAKVTYTVTVKGADGKAIAGVSVQLCEGDRCLLPVTTDANGVATFNDVEAVYQAQITKAVDGYVVDTAKKYDFASGAKALEIVLQAAASNVVVPADKQDITASVGSADAPESVELAAGKSVSYVYNALTDGTIEINLVAGKAATITVSNITNNKTGFTVDGVGSIGLSTRAGNSYLIVVTATEAETVKFYVELSDEGNGSKENPFHLYMGDIQTTVQVPAGETVYFVYEDERYLLIENPTVTVDLNGVVYVPDIYGNITAEAIGLKSGDLFGVVGGAEDTTVTIKLTGSDAEHPLPVRGYGEFSLNVPVSATAYFTVDPSNLNNVLDSITGNVTASSWGVEFTAPVLFHQSQQLGVSAFALTNNSNSYVAPVTFVVTTAPLGVFEANPIELDETGYTTVTLHDQKISKNLFFTATAAEYGYFKTNVPGAPLAVNGEAVADMIDLSVDEFLVNAGDEIFFVLSFDAVEDTFLSYGIEYVSVYAEDLGATNVTIPAGVSYTFKVPMNVLSNGVYLSALELPEGVTATCFEQPVAAPAVFSMMGLQEIVLSNTTEAEATAVVTLAAMPAGTDMMNPIILDAEAESYTIDVLTQQLSKSFMGSSVFFQYTVAADGVLTTTVPANVVMIGETYPEFDASDLAAGVAVKAGDVVLFVVPCMPDQDGNFAEVALGYAVTAPVVEETLAE